MSRKKPRNIKKKQDLSQVLEKDVFHGIESDDEKPLKIFDSSNKKYRVKDLEKKQSNELKLSKKTESAVMYLGRIPHGFFENEMKQYFSQFGKVNKIKLFRNPKTGKSQHFAFIKFDSKDTAKVVVEATNNYLIDGHLLQCHLVENPSPTLFNNLYPKKKLIDVDKPVDKSKNLKRLNSLNQKLKSRGIDYEYTF